MGKNETVARYSNVACQNRWLFATHCLITFSFFVESVPECGVLSLHQSIQFSENVVWKEFLGLHLLFTTSVVELCILAATWNVS